MVDLEAQRVEDTRTALKDFETLYNTLNNLKETVRH